MGFNVSNDLFAEHSWYFRNALVRANYRNYVRCIEPEFEPLENFFRNLLLGETNELKNRYLVINAPEELTPQVTLIHPQVDSRRCFLSETHISNR